MLSRLMRKAHKLAKTFEGNYRARMSLALKLAWKEEKEEKEMNKKPIIEDWWLRKNSAQECLLNEFSNLEVTQETEKATLFNDEVWVPKSVIEWKEVNEDDIEDERKVGVFVEEYSDCEWYDYKFRRESRKRKEEFGENRDQFARHYDLAVEKGYIK